MSGGGFFHFTDDDAAWLEQEQAKPVERPQHACGRCKTPFGRSALPCPNDPNIDPNARLRERLGT